MPHICSAKPFLLLNDLKNCVKKNSKLIALSFVLASAGAALGALIACKIGEKAAPYSVFACLFKLSYAPFSFVFSYLLRFFLYLLIASFGFFLPLSAFYPSIALVLYGRSVARNVATAFLTDSIGCSVLSLVFVELPLFLLGVSLFAFTFVKISERKMCRGIALNAKTLTEILPYLLKCLTLYFIALFLIFVVICGATYLLVVVL